MARKKKKTDGDGAIGKLLGHYARLRGKRLALKHELEAAARQEMEAQQKLLVACRAAGLEKVTGPDGTFSHKNVSVLRVSDWPAFYGWIKRSGHFECLEKRPHQAQIQAVLEEDARLAKRGIPGGTFETVAKAHFSARKS